MRSAVWIVLIFSLTLGGCIRSQITLFPHAQPVIQQKQMHPQPTKAVLQTKVPSFYLVQQGDTLYTIGQRFGVPFQQLAEQNRIKEPYLLNVGQRIELASPIYKVRRGDTLYMIGQKFNVDYKGLAARNHIPYPFQIYVGQQIFLYGFAPEAKMIPIPVDQTVMSDPAIIKDKKQKTRDIEKNIQSESATPVADESGPLRFHWPVLGRMTQPFGQIDGKMSDGIDIESAEGTPVYAAERGTVVYVGQQVVGYGKMIIIRHENKLFTVYAHNQDNLVKVGDSLKRGALIAKVGRTGRGSTPHLHFEVRHSSTPVDPLDYLPKPHSTRKKGAG
ncbi:MAG: M23 family metallopeptidase [Zetaproteobacteria bacterium]|nr:M23 family metallopeptidase [Zetaproteobacteria bacterium]